jgi:hypothetical protein
MPEKYDTERKKRIKIIGRKPDLRTDPLEGKVDVVFKEQLEQSKKKLHEAQNLKDQKKILKLQEIISNLEASLSRV